jgi:hypothetical protein
MKKDGSNNMMTMVMVIGGLGAAYWYLTRYGPNGAAFNSAGQQVALTWWDSWFGGAAAQAATAQVTTVSPATVTQTPGGATQPAPSATADVRTKLLTAAGGVNSLTADQWDYYRNQLYPPSLSPNQFGLAFPVRTDPMPVMSVDQFIAALTAAGINPASPGGGVSGIYNTPSVSNVPSMSFGGSLAQNRPRIGAPSVYRNRSIGGQTIQ